MHLIKVDVFLDKSPSPEDKVEAGQEFDHLGGGHGRRVDEAVSLARLRVPHGEPEDCVLRRQGDEADVLQFPG